VTVSDDRSEHEWLAAVEVVTAERAEVDARWRDTIRAAAEAGVQPRVLARPAGVPTSVVRQVIGPRVRPGNAP
jgi:hypothetical protein